MYETYSMPVLIYPSLLRKSSPRCISSRLTALKEREGRKDICQILGLERGVGISSTASSKRLNLKMILRLHTICYTKQEENKN